MQEIRKTPMKIPLLSIITPVYNVEAYLDKCVQSVLSQSYRNIEMILVDDGSTDSSAVLCDKWAQEDSRVIVIHKVNGGVSSARNAGLEVASGEFITFVDPDDLLLQKPMLLIWIICWNTMILILFNILIVIM